MIEKRRMVSSMVHSPSVVKRTSSVLSASYSGFVDNFHYRYGSNMSKY